MKSIIRQIQMVPFCLMLSQIKPSMKRSRIASILLLFLFSVSLFSSCQILLRTTLGIGLPKEESILSQQKLLSKHHIRTSNLMQLKNNYLDSLRSGYCKLRTDQRDSSGFSPIQFLLFDSAGQLVTAWAFCYGKLEEAGWLDSFPPPPLFRMNHFVTLEKVAKMLTNEMDEEVSFNGLLGKNKYVLIEYWAGYLGHYSLDMLARLDAYVDRYKEKKIQQILVNIGSD